MKRTDDNQTKVVEGLRGLGYSVRSTAEVGNGFPDLVVGKWGRTFLFEVKDPAKIPSKRAPTPAEKKFHQTWRGHCAVIETWEEAHMQMMEQRP